MIYEARGFQNNLVYPYDKIEPFDYIAQFRPMRVPEGADIEQFKRTQAPPTALVEKSQQIKKGLAGATITV